VSRALRWDARALDVLRRLERRDPAAARRIRDAAERFAETERGDIRKLKGRADLWRLRVGEWRAIFATDAPSTMTVLTAELRRDTYRN
jgi:mRNA-degrading endonuclease RelE of RelBE toxin-antitoxin system